MRTIRAQAAIAVLALLHQSPLQEVPFEAHEGFEELRLHLEVDLPPTEVVDARRLASSRAAILDLPAEVVLEVASARGLSELSLYRPDGLPALHLTSPGAAPIGLSEVALECEGSTLRDALRAYPQGEYLVAATALDGTRIAGAVTLRHRLPGFFDVRSPLPGADLPKGDVTIAWTPSQGAARYCLEIEQDESGFALELTLPADRRSVTIPEGLLPPHGPCEYSLLVQGDTDNEVEREGEFTLVPR